MITLLCSDAGVSPVNVGITRIYPSRLIPLFLPWPVEDPTSLKNAIKQYAPEDNPLVEFFRQNPDLE